MLINLRCLLREIRQIIHPRSVSVVKLDGKVVEENTLRSVSIFTCCYFAVILLTTLLVSLDNFPFPPTFPPR